MITQARRTESGGIIATIDGQEMHVPTDPANRHRQMLEAWEADGGAIEPYAEPAPDLIAYTAQRRWEYESGGITVGGMSIYTDDRSKMMIMGARIKAQSDPQFTTQWKSASGDFVTIDAQTIIVVSDAVLDHVDSCFAAEAQVLAAIAAEQITTTEQIDAAFIAVLPDQ